jgi:hypothetical protein
MTIWDIASQLLLLSGNELATRECKRACMRLDCASHLWPPPTYASLKRCLCCVSFHDCGITSQMDCGGLRSTAATAGRLDKKQIRDLALPGQLRGGTSASETPEGRNRGVKGSIQQHRAQLAMIEDEGFWPLHETTKTHNRAHTAATVATLLLQCTLM